MRTDILRRSAASSLVLALAACGGAPAESATPASSSAPTAAPAASPAPKPPAAPIAVPPGMKLVEIPKLGLVGFAANGGTVKEEKLVTTKDFSAQVHAPVDMDPTTPEKGHTEAQVLLNEPKIKDEILPDGWIVTAESKTNFYGFAYRTLNGKPVACETLLLDAKSRDAAMAFCKTLRVR